MEADPRHAELLLAAANLSDTKAKSLSTPGTKNALDGSEQVPLLGDDYRNFRSMAMRLCYLSQDRPELAFAAKELARDVQSPSRYSEAALKRCCRFLVSARRCIWSFPRQSAVSCIEAYSDTDWAGCVRTRRSTSCSLLFHGKHLISASSTTQNVVSLSSGEAEYYGLVKTASRAMGLQALMRDFNKEVTINIYVDSTACKGIASRRGVGRIRHLHVQVLWIQDAVQAGKVRILKVDGSKNPSDMGTKHLAIRPLTSCMEKCGLRLDKGSSAIALRASV